MPGRGSSPAGIVLRRLLSDYAGKLGIRIDADHPIIDVVAVRPGMPVRWPRLDASEDWAEGGGDDDRPDDEDEGDQRDSRYSERGDAQPSDGGAGGEPGLGE